MPPLDLVILLSILNPHDMIVTSFTGKITTLFLAPPLGDSPERYTKITPHIHLTYSTSSFWSQHLKFQIARLLPPLTTKAHCIATKLDYSLYLSPSYTQTEKCHTPAHIIRILSDIFFLAFIPLVGTDSPSSHSHKIVHYTYILVNMALLFGIWLLLQVLILLLRYFICTKEAIHGPGMMMVVSLLRTL